MVHKPFRATIGFQSPHPARTGSRGVDSQEHMEVCPRDRDRGVVHVHTQYCIEE